MASQMAIFEEEQTAFTQICERLVRDAPRQSHLYRGFGWSVDHRDGRNVGYRHHRDWRRLLRVRPQQQAVWPRCSEKKNSPCTSTKANVTISTCH